MSSGKTTDSSSRRPKIFEVNANFYSEKKAAIEFYGHLRGTHS